MPRRRVLFHPPGVPWLLVLSPFFVPPLFSGPTWGKPKKQVIPKKLLRSRTRRPYNPLREYLRPPGRAGGGRRASRRRRCADLPGLVWCWLAVVCAVAGCGGVVWAVVGAGGAVCWLCPLCWRCRCGWCCGVVWAVCWCWWCWLLILHGWRSALALGLGGTIGGRK